MKIGILREGKNPPDKRVPFSPTQCYTILSQYPHISIYIQSSSHRCFLDSDYLEKGVIIKEDLSECNIIMGIKEVPINMLIDGKVFLFFSHTIKKQSYNQDLLKTIIRKKIQLIDYETLVDENYKRLIGFGRYAGIVGAYNTFLAYGKKTKKFDLKFAHLLKDKTELEQELLKVILPDNFRIILTGEGRVAQGAKEILNLLSIEKVNKQSYLKHQFNQPIFVQLVSTDYNERKDGGDVSKIDFYKYPEDYQSCLPKYTSCSNMLITGHYYASGSPIILSKDDIKNDTFKVEVIGDISCDIDGPIGSTIRPSTIENPIYGYNRKTGFEENYEKENVLVVMAVDNLPCSLPKDASIDFGNVFVNQILSDLLNGGAVTSRATITLNGELTKRFLYLLDYIN